VAQSSLGSGLSRSAASLPFPGEVVIAGPGLFYTVTGMTIPGSYPFYVAAEYPTAPESTLADPSGQYSLRATATDRSAAGAAQALFGGGDGGGGSRTETAVETAPDGSAVARAESVTHGLSVGKGALKIAAVHSRSVTTLASDATTATTERSLVVEGATVAGQPVTIDADGIHASGGSAPVPFGPGAEQVTTALAQSGLSARVLTEDDGKGAAAQVLEIQSRHPLPFAGNPEGVFSWRIGRTTTSLVRTGFLPVADPGAEESGAAGDQPATGPGTATEPTSPVALGGATGTATVLSGLGPALGMARRAVGAEVPAGYDPGPVADLFETTGPAAGEQASGALPAAGRAAPASASSPVGLDSVRGLYRAVGVGALLIAGLAGLWQRRLGPSKGVS
jgi:hypothetical protein